MYENTSYDCPACTGDLETQKEVELAGMIEFALGAQLLAASPGGPRYRYLMNIEDDKDTLAMNGATHSVDINCYLLAPTAPLTSTSCGNASIDPRKKLRLSKLIIEYWTSFANTGV